MRNHYKAPVIESVQIQEPLAYACTIYNASDSGAGCWTGAGVSTPSFCCGPDCDIKCAC